MAADRTAPPPVNGEATNDKNGKSPKYAELGWSHDNLAFRK